MASDELKKSIYKGNPEATFVRIKKGSAYYQSWVNSHGVINFEIPVTDMGEAEFSPKMQAKHLIRWIVESD